MVRHRLVRILVELDHERERMTVQHYRTIDGISEGVYRELASKFIARAFHVTDEASFKREAEQLASEHPASRHVCYAWVLGNAGDRHRANDDGEPTGTAGKPILRQLQAAGLTYCGLVVVRYFGGTLLGRAGLIHAYGEAARLALANASIVERVLMDRFTVTCTYDRFDGLKTDVLSRGGRLLESVFSERCTTTIELPKGMCDLLIPKWSQLGLVVEPQ